MTNKASCLALIVVFAGLPAVLGLAASSDWWVGIKAETAAAHHRSESMFDPLPEQ